jgi:hypothetical protein
MKILNFQISYLYSYKKAQIADAQGPDKDISHWKPKPAAIVDSRCSLPLKICCFVLMFHTQKWIDQGSRERNTRTKDHKNELSNKQAQLRIAVVSGTLETEAPRHTILPYLLLLICVGYSAKRIKIIRRTSNKNKHKKYWTSLKEHRRTDELWPGGRTVTA